MNTKMSTAKKEHKNPVLLVESTCATTIGEMVIKYKRIDFLFPSKIKKGSVTKSANVSDHPVLCAEKPVYHNARTP